MISDTEKDQRPNDGYLAQHGATLLDQGYNIVPIQVGKKAPGFDGWQKTRASKPQLEDWIEHGHRRSGVGIITKHTPAVDIDVRDEAVALSMEAWVREHIGDAPLRIGRAPKRLLVFRTDEPFRKMRSTKYRDEWGDEHQIEILGDGQQFVAFHKHPDTGKPYTWPNEDSPLNVPAKELPVLTVEQCQKLIEFFEDRADEEGWDVVKKGRQQAVAIDSDNPFVEDSAPIIISDEDLRNRLLLIPHPEDYDEWIRIGMALYHQYDGDEFGLKLWHEWAESADNYDGDSLDRRWGEGFEIKGKRRAPITARYIIRLSQEATEGAAQELALKLHTAFLSAKDLSEWEKARKMAREAEIDAMARSSLASTAKESRDRITGKKTPIAEVKKAIAYVPKKTEKTPVWCASWLYDTSDDRFYHTVTKIAATQQGFNAMHDRNAMTKKDVLDGKSSPSSTASALALNLYRIPTVTGRRYAPGRDAIFIEKDGTFANTYPEHEIPAKPEKITPKDKRNIERVKRHIAHLLPDPREQRMLLDWLSWVVQHPGKHANYAILLQGVQGDGKTFFAELMRAVMGVSNVTMLNAHILHSDFTDWAEGQCLACIEEVRLINDKNKYEIINRVKPFITNNIIEVHPKGKPIRNVKNTTSYLLFTNYRDALPIDDNDRRYLALFSQWQRKEAIAKFKAENPTYYSDLYATIEESPGAIRQWMLQHEQSDAFTAMGDAPDTPARRFMIRQAKPEFIQQLDNIVAENNIPEIGYDLLDATFLCDYMVSIGLDFPAPKALTMMLQRDGYEAVGRIKMEDKSYHYFYSKRPEQFHVQYGNSIEFDFNKVRSYLKRRRQEVEDDEL